MNDAPSRATLAYANAHRPWQIYKTVFDDIRALCESEARRHKRRFRFKHKLLSLDSTTIPLSLSLFDWAHYQTGKGAAKVHMVLSHDGFLPQFAVVTDGKTSDTEAAEAMTFAPARCWSSTAGTTPTTGGCG